MSNLYDFVPDLVTGKLKAELDNIRARKEVEELKAKNDNLLDAGSDMIKSLHRLLSLHCCGKPKESDIRLAIVDAMKSIGNWEALK